MADPIWASQPFKAIFTIFFLLKTPPHLALLGLLYLARPMRPLAAWSVRANIVSTALRMLNQYITTTRKQYFMCADPTTAKDRHSRIQPPADHLLNGVLKGSREGIRPAPVDAIWFPSPAPRDRTELKKQKVVLHLPGGAHIIAMSHDVAGPPLADTLATYMKATRTVWAQYRLAGTPETCFPAALQDAVTFYHHLLSLGIDSDNIIISGDSAGGNLVLALLRFLESSPSLPQPGGAMVFSPWVNITACAGRDYEQNRYSKSDMLSSSLLQWGAESYLPKGEFSSGELAKDVRPFISPLHHPFKLSTPLFIHAGAAEGFHDDIKSFAQEMTQMNGHRVQFHATPLAPHALIHVHRAYGMTGELIVAMKEAAEFFDL